MYIWAHPGAEGKTYRFSLWDMDLAWGCERESIGEQYENWMYFPVLDRMLNLNAGGIRQKADGTFYFTSESHTGVNVPVSAVGAGTEFFHEKTVENVEIARFMGRAWGVEKLGAQG
jgi:hypothetical protein